MNKEKLATPRGLNLKAVIICDDFDFAVAASAALERVGKREAINAQWAVRYWRANALNEITTARKALRESLDAHLIVLPARYAQDFPIWLRDWLERWAAHRRIKEAALGVIRVANAGGSAGSYAELRKFILQHSLHFVGEKSPIANGPQEVPVTFQAGVRIEPTVISSTTSLKQLQGDLPGPLSKLTTADQEEPNAIRNRRDLFLPVQASGVVIVVLILFCLIGCKKKPATPASSPPTVQVLSVIRSDVPVYHEWIGYLDGLVNAEVRAQVTGYLIKQNYVEGDPIKKGDVLFEIDARPFQAVLDQAKGQLAEAEARLGKTELDVKRYGPLVKDRAISQEEYDDAVQANLGAKAAVVSAKAQVEQAQINLDFTRIISPIDGIASIARAQVGNLVGPATGELTTVSTIDPIKVYYNVTEQAYINFAKLFTGDIDRSERLRQLKIQLVLADGSVYPHAGRIYAADRQLGTTTGALRLEALFPNPEGSLRPGQFARVRVKLDDAHDALMVPQRAVSELQGSFQVMVVGESNKVHIQPVQVGERSGSFWVIKHGLQPGARVIVEGLQKVREGTLVNPTNYPATPVFTTTQ